MNIYFSKVRLIYEFLMFMERKYPYPYFALNDGYAITFIKEFEIFLNNNRKTPMYCINSSMTQDELMNLIISRLVTFGARYTSYHLHQLILRALHNIPIIRSSRPCLCIANSRNYYKCCSKERYFVYTEEDICENRSSVQNTEQIVEANLQILNQEIMEYMEKGHMPILGMPAQKKMLHTAPNRLISHYYSSFIYDYICNNITMWEEVVFIFSEVGHGPHITKKNFQKALTEKIISIITLQ